MERIALSFDRKDTWFKMLTVFLLLSVTLAFPFLGWAEDTPAAPPEAHKESMTEINKKLTNPVSELWSLAFQQNNYYLRNPSGYWQSDLQFQPVMPVALTKEWNLITRPVLQLFNSTVYPIQRNNAGRPTVDYDRTTGFGDTTLMELLSPGSELVGKWILGIGPTFIFPTASTYWTGQGKYQAGPAGVVGYLSEKWILGALVQNWTSFAGNNNRSTTNQMNLQPIAAYFFADGWSIGYSGNILANWEADSARNVWTVPLGLGINKVVKLGRLPVKISLAGEYMPIHPDSYGQQWNVQIQFVPVIPKLISKTLFD